MVNVVVAHPAGERKQVADDKQPKKNNSKRRGLGSHLLGDENKAERFMGQRVDLLFAFLTI